MIFVAEMPLQHHVYKSFRYVNVTLVYCVIVYICSVRKSKCCALDIIQPMLRRVIFQFLLLISAMLLIVKPLIGFSLYHQAKNQSENEFITVIKAFSKRKQEYLDWVDVKDTVCLTLSPLRHFVAKIKEFFITHFFNTFFPNSGTFSIDNFFSKIVLPLERLYLRNLQLTL